MVSNPIQCPLPLSSVSPLDLLAPPLTPVRVPARPYEWEVVEVERDGNRSYDALCVCQYTVFGKLQPKGFLGGRKMRKMRKAKKREEKSRNREWGARLNLL